MHGGKYKIIRHEHDGDRILAQCNFEDRDVFKQIAENPFCKILLNGEDVTEKYQTMQ